MLNTYLQFKCKKPHKELSFLNLKSIDPTEIPQTIVAWAELLYPVRDWVLGWNSPSQKQQISNSLIKMMDTPELEDYSSSGNINLIWRGLSVLHKDLFGIAKTGGINEQVAGGWTTSRGMARGFSHMGKGGEYINIAWINYLMPNYPIPIMISLDAATLEDLNAILFNYVHFINDSSTREILQAIPQIGSQKVKGTISLSNFSKDLLKHKDEDEIILKPIIIPAKNILVLKPEFPEGESPSGTPTLKRVKLLDYMKSDHANNLMGQWIEFNEANPNDARYKL